MVLIKVKKPTANKVHTPYPSWFSTSVGSTEFRFGTPYCDPL